MSYYNNQTIHSPSKASPRSERVKSCQLQRNIKHLVKIYVSFAISGITEGTIRPKCENSESHSKAGMEQAFSALVSFRAGIKS